MTQPSPTGSHDTSIEDALVGHFDIPVVLLLFLRKDAALSIVEKLRTLRPSRVYLISDEGRNPAERDIVAELRTAIEKAIDWECRVVRNYATENRGVYANIALGAKWVFEREERAIFLEDDNIPESSFFRYCEEMLDRFEGDNRVLWVCGTNYLGDGSNPGGPSYHFTRHLLPCGWASWSAKFLRYYDFGLALTDDPAVMNALAGQYEDKRLWRQQIQSIMAERRRRDRGVPYSSWDYHMALSIRANGLLGVAPAKNQIRNVGADELSTHGGFSTSQIMTRRFCGMDSFPLPFPLQHPRTAQPDQDFEQRIGRIILHPLALRIKARARRIVERTLRLNPDVELTTYVRRLLRRRIP